MAKKTRQVVENPKVRCCDCENFQRDTEGRSRTPEGEYFLVI